MANAAVYKYLQQQNRPYSANDIVQNLHKEYGKTVVQKALDLLVEEKRILEKVYGKQKVYSVIQQDTNNVEMEQEIKTLDVECEKVGNNLKTTQDELKQMESVLKVLQNSLTTREAIDKRDQLKTGNEEMKTRLENLQQTQVAITNEEKQQITSEHEKYLKEYRKRRRICMDMIDSIMEGYPKSKKELLEEIGIETDEDVGFKLNSN